MARDKVMDSTKTGWAKVSDVIAYLSISRSTAYKLMDSGQLQYAQIGGARRISWAAVHKLLENGTSAAAG